MSWIFPVTPCEPLRKWRSLLKVTFTSNSPFPWEHTRGTNSRCNSFVASNEATLHCSATHTKVALLVPSNKPRDWQQASINNCGCEATAHWAEGTSPHSFLVCASGTLLPCCLQGMNSKSVLAVPRCEAMNIEYKAGLTKLRSHLWKTPTTISDFSVKDHLRRLGSSFSQCHHHYQPQLTDPKLSNRITVLDQHQHFRQNN